MADICKHDLVRLHLIALRPVELDSGEVIVSGDYGGYRVATTLGDVRVLLALQSWDLVDVTDQQNRFTIFERGTDALARTIWLNP